VGSKQEKEQFHEVPVILRRKQVEARVGLTRSTIYRRIAERTFPSPVSLGLRAVGWVEAEISDWLLSRLAKRRRAR